MHLVGLLLTIISFMFLFSKTSSLREEIDEDKELKELGDNIKFYHQNGVPKLEDLVSRRSDGRAKFTLNTRPLKSRLSTWKRFHHSMPFSYEYPHVTSSYHNRWWPITDHTLWPEYGWKDGFYCGHGCGSLAWNQNYPKFPWSHCACGHWCSKLSPNILSLCEIWSY